MITTKADIYLDKTINDNLFLLSVKLQRYKQWIPGMFMQISLKETTASEPWLDGRSFSFASWGDDTAKILVRKEGAFTTELVKNSSEGFTTSVRYPFGSFLLNSNKNKVFLAGGAGISVFLSYLDYINLSRIYSGNALLIYTVKRKSESIENIYSRKVPNCVTVKQFFTNVNESGYTGRFTVDDLYNAISDIDDKEVFICGPPKFNSFWVDTLKSLGIYPKIEQWENQVTF